MIQKVNLASAFASFADPWNPRVAGDVNTMQVKLVKLQGTFSWHHHEHEDELFLVVRGRLLMRLRDGDVVVEPGEFVIIPHRVEHCPEALEEPCEVVLLEPATTLNTGTEHNERTRQQLERIV